MEIIQTIPTLGNSIFVRDNAINDDINNRLIQSVKLTTNILNNEGNSLKMIWSGGIDFLANETFVYVPETHQSQQGADNGFVGIGKNNFKITIFLVYRVNKDAERDLANNSSWYFIFIKRC